MTDSLAWVDDERFPRILDAMNARMMRGDVPLNLTATSLMLNAFMATGEPSYRAWVKDYVTAWMDRVEQNNGILPDNVGSLETLVSTWMEMVGRILWLAVAPMACSINSNPRLLEG